MPSRSRALRIAHVITAFDRGGAERVLLKTVQRLDAERFHSSIVSLRSPGPLSDAALRLGVSVVHLGMGRRPGPLTLWRLARFLRRQRIDVVHAYLYDATIASRLAGWIAGVPVVLTSTRASLEYLPRYAWWVDRATARLSRRIIAVSRGTAKFITKQEKIPAAKVLVIPNGVDTDEFRPGDRPTARARWHIPSGAAVVACVGRLHAQKGHTYLLQALQSLRSESPRIICIVAGEGPLREALEAEVAARDLTDVCRLVGDVSDITSVYAAADVIASPSLYEGMPNTVLEAMAVGRPVIATAVQGSEDIVRSGETGLLVPPGDAEALLGALRQLLRAPELRASMGNRAREIAIADHRLDRMVKQIEALYLAEWEGVTRGS
jgi:glycosyltransferase involved in cell wall biosynthesis